MALRLSKSKSFNEPKQPPIPEMSKLPVSKTQAEYLAEARQIFIDNYREKIIGELLVSVAAPPPPAIGDNYGSVTSSAVSSIDKLSSIAEYPTDTDSQSEDQPADGENSFKPSTQRSHRKLRSQITTPPPPVPVDPRRHAKLVLKSGDVYEGQVLLEDGGVMDGYGSLQWSDGQRYEGQFLANKITGKGRYFWSDGFDYIGELLNGRRHGQGRWSSAIHNLLAEGSWQHGGLSGDATVNYGDQSEKPHVYHGEFRQNQQEGTGKMQYPSGNWYEGEWMNGKRHGKGLMVWADRGEQYQGEWKNGTIHGQGEYIWPGFNPQLPFRFPRHNIYRGNWIDGKRSGQGQFYYSTGAWYNGQWKDNQKHGEGMYCGEDGSILKGQWADDRFLGERITPTGSCAYLFDVSTFTADDDDELVYGRDVEERCNTALNMIVQRHNHFLRNAYAYYFSPLKSGENPVKIGFNKFNVWTIINDYGIKKLGLTIVDFERAFARRFRNHPLYHGKFYECPFSAGTELNFREFLECFIHMASVLPVPSNVNANDIAAKLNYLLTTCSAIQPIRSTPAHDHQLEKVYLHRAKPHLINSLPASPGDKTMTVREVLFMLQEFGPRRQSSGMKFTAKLLLEAISKVAPTALTGDDAVDLSLELSYFDLLIIVSHLNKLQPAYSRDLPMNCEQMDTLMSY